jgi:hypothetical protein
MAEYQIWAYDVWGQRIAVLDRLTKLSYVRTVNAVGALTATVPRDELPDAVVREDMRLEVWRKPAGGTWGLDGDTAWFLQQDVRGRDDRQGRYRRLVAASATQLLARRLIAYDAGTVPQASRGANADDAMKGFVSENLGGSAVVGRDRSTWIFVQPNVSMGPVVSKDVPWRNLLAVLQEIARDAFVAGTPVYFDLVSGSTTLLEFRTWVNVRGIDRSIASGGTEAVTLSIERGSLGGTVEVAIDWSDAVSAVYAGGPRQAGARLVGLASDAIRIGASPFGLREGWIDATGADTLAALNAEANSELNRRRPRKVLTGEILSVPGSAYGVDWGWGDLVKAEFEGDAFDARIDSVAVTVERGEEKIVAQIRAEAIG